MEFNTALFKLAHSLVSFHITLKRTETHINNMAARDAVNRYNSPLQDMVKIKTLQSINMYVF